MDETRAHFFLCCSLLGPTLSGFGKPCSLHVCADAQVHAGGNVDFVIGTQKNGAAFWTKTESSSGTHPGGWDWARSDTELHTLTFAGRLADHLIKGQASKDKDSCESYQSGECTNQAPNMDAPGWGWDICCWLVAAVMPDAGTLENYLAMPIEELSVLWNPECADSLSPDWFMEKSSLFLAPVVYGAIGDAVAGNACGCTDHMNSLCQGEHCVTPSCADLNQYCQEDSTAGLVTRQWCPITCGCVNAFSDLIRSGLQFGCSRTCLAKHKKQTAGRPCADTAAESPELIAVASSLEAYVADQQNANMVTLAKGLGSVGCQALKEQEAWLAVLCRSSGEDIGWKGLDLFCPVTCGCEGGCPSNCSSKPGT